MVDFHFLLYSIRALCFVFPPVSFLVTQDWSKVYNDCYGPGILIADTVVTVVTLCYHIYSNKRYGNLAPVVLYSFGLGFDIMSLCMFAMHQSLSGGLKRSIKWFYTVLGMFALTALLIFLWIEMGATIEGQEESDMAMWGYVIALCGEIFQMLWPAYVRLHKNNFATDEKGIYWLKMSSTTLIAATSTAEFFCMREEKFWNDPVLWPLMVLSAASAICAILQLIVRNMFHQDNLLHKDDDGEVQLQPPAFRYHF